MGHSGVPVWLVEVKPLLNFLHGDITKIKKKVLEELISLWPGGPRQEI